MSTLTRARQIQHQIVKAQRRVWFLQAALWSALVLAGVSAVATATWWARRQLTSRPAPAPVDPATNGHHP